MSRHRADRKALTLLLVDDTPTVRRELSSLLAELPCVQRVETAASGEGALRALDAVRPDLVVLDLAMPGMGGLEVLDRIRAREDGACPVVILSNESDANTRRRTRSAGAVAHFDKSLEIEALRRWIAREGGCEAPSGEERARHHV